MFFLLIFMFSSYLFSFCGRSSPEHSACKAGEGKSERGCKKGGEDGNKKKGGERRRRAASLSSQADIMKLLLC